MNENELQKFLNDSEIQFRQTIPLFQNKDFVSLCHDYTHASRDQRDQLVSKFGNFDVEQNEIITLKSDIDPKDWRKTVNYHKMNSYEYMCMLAVIDLATKLDEGVDPLTAMDYMAGRNLPTPIMEAFIFHTIDHYHPRGWETLQEWKSYCDKVYGQAKQNK